MVAFWRVRLAAAQQRLAAKRGSKNRAKARRKAPGIARSPTHAASFHHKSARYLVQSYGAIAVEHLQIANMQRLAKPMPDPKSRPVPGAIVSLAKTGEPKRPSMLCGGKLGLSILATKSGRPLDASGSPVVPAHLGRLAYLPGI